MTDSKTFYSVKEAAQLTGVGRRTILRRIEQGEVDAMPTGSGHHTMVTGRGLQQIRELSYRKKGTIPTKRTLYALDDASRQLGITRTVLDKKLKAMNVEPIEKGSRKRLFINKATFEVLRDDNSSH